LVQSTYDELKILGNGEVHKEAQGFPPIGSARRPATKITAAGGEAIVLPAKLRSSKVRKK